MIEEQYLLVKVCEIPSGYRYYTEVTFFEVPKDKKGNIAFKLIPVGQNFSDLKKCVEISKSALNASCEKLTGAFERIIAAKKTFEGI